MNKMTKNKLFNVEEAGFSEKETKVYLALLELGEASVSDIAKKAKVDRATVYRILQKLLAIPLVQTYQERKKTRWAALNPRYLIDYVNRKKRAVVELFPDLQALYNLNEEKPKLSYFEGEDGLKELTANIIKETKHRGELLSFSAPGAAAVYHTKKEFLKLAWDRIKKQIMSKILIPSIKEVPGYAEGEDFKNWRHVKIVNAKKFPFKATINIWNNKISIMTVRTHPIGVVIESKDIADTMRSIFEFFWDNIN